MKTLLTKSVGTHLLSVEELYSILAEFEAVLNSRPLTTGICSSRRNPSLDSRALPGWQTTQGTASSRPEPQEDRRWNLCQRLAADLWERWSRDYLQQLQRFSKWRRPQKSLQVRDVVLLKDTELFTRSWPLARIIETHLGKDGLVRVVTLKTEKGIYKRAVHCLVPLPVEEKTLPLLLKGGRMFGI